MASSSARQDTGSSDSGLQINTGSSYVIKPKTMAIPFVVQVESPVDFASLKRNGMNLDALMAAQHMFPYFNMLNGPTYVKLVKDFWVRAEVYDVDAAKTEELQAVARDPNLKGKTRKEMGLEPFRQTEIRSAVMGIPITITEEVIAKACWVAPSGRFPWNVSRKHPLLKMMEEQKKKKEDYLAARDARLKSLGLEDCDEYYVQKLAEVKQIAGTVEKETIKEAKEMLEQIQGTSEAAPKSATVAEASEASAKVIQIPDLPTIIPNLLSPSNDSDHDELPLGQRMKMLPKLHQTTKQTPL